MDSVFMKMRSCATSSSTHLRKPTSLRCIFSIFRSILRAPSPVGLNPTGEGAPLVMPFSTASVRAAFFNRPNASLSVASNVSSAALASSSGVFASFAFARGFTPGAALWNIFFIF